MGNRSLYATHVARAPRGRGSVTAEIANSFEEMDALGGQRGAPEDPTRPVVSSDGFSENSPFHETLFAEPAP